MDYTVSAVDETLGLLLLVSAQPGLGVSELARRSGNTKARAFRLLSKLEQREFVQREKGSATYHLGLAALLVGVSSRDQIALVREGLLHVQGLAQRFGARAQLRVRDGLESVCVVRSDPARLGATLADYRNGRALHAGASGKVLLAYGPKEIREAVLQGGLTRFTVNTIVQRSRLLQELTRVRQHGVATSSAEVSAECRSIAAPVRDARDTVVAALSLSFSNRGHTAERSSEIIAVVVQAAQELSRKMGAPRQSEHED